MLNSGRVLTDDDDEPMAEKKYVEDKIQLFVAFISFKKSLFSRICIA